MSYTTPATASDLKHRFKFHAAETRDRRVAHESVRSELYITALELDRIVPPGREKSLAITKLEEAMFWANAAIARHTTES
ncbi:Acb2/Tad1 domain-containing protein [Mycolicibacterium palauense]